MEKCIFCKIVAKEAQAFMVNEDDKHIAFLDVYPLVEGQTVVTTKKHHSGYGFDMPEGEFKELMAFAQRTAKKIDSGLGAERCMQVLQGYAIDHVHAKLFPVMKVNERVVSDENYAKLIPVLREGWYNGVIISMSGKERESDERLRKLLNRINGWE